MDAPVRARVRAGLVKVDEHTRVAECAATAVAGRGAALDEADGLVLDELDGGEWPGLERLVGLLEARADHGLGAARSARARSQRWSERRERGREEEEESGRGETDRAACDFDQVVVRLGACAGPTEGGVCGALRVQEGQPRRGGDEDEEAREEVDARRDARDLVVGGTGAGDEPGRLASERAEHLCGG